MNQKRKDRASPQVLGAHLNRNLERLRRKGWFRKRLPNLARSLVYSAIITIGDLIVLLVLTREISGSLEWVQRKKKKEKIVRNALVSSLWWRSACRWCRRCRWACIACSCNPMAPHSE